MLDIDCRTKSEQTPTQIKAEDPLAGFSTVKGSRRRGKPFEVLLGDSLDQMEPKEIMRTTKAILEKQDPQMLIYQPQTVQDGNVCGQRMLTHALQKNIISYEVLKLIADYETDVALNSPDPDVVRSMQTILADGELITKCGITHEFVLKGFVRHAFGNDAWQHYNMASESEFKELFNKALNVCVSWKGNGSVDHWACSALYS